MFSKQILSILFLLSLASHVMAISVNQVQEQLKGLVDTDLMEFINQNPEEEPSKNFTQGLQIVAKNLCDKNFSIKIEDKDLITKTLLKDMNFNNADITFEEVVYILALNAINTK